MKSGYVQYVVTFMRERIRRRHVLCARFLLPSSNCRKRK